MARRVRWWWEVGLPQQRTASPASPQQDPWTQPSPSLATGELWTPARATAGIATGASLLCGRHARGSGAAMLVEGSGLERQVEGGERRTHGGKASA